MQPSLIFVHPVTGFQLDSVHSIVDFKAMVLNPF
jgi:hypothetical protein